MDLRPRGVGHNKNDLPSPKICIKSINQILFPLLPLCLVVKQPKSWEFRHISRQKQAYIGLGPLHNGFTQVLGSAKNHENTPDHCFPSLKATYNISVIMTLYIQTGETQRILNCKKNWTFLLQGFEIIDKECHLVVIRCRKTCKMSHLLFSLKT